MTAQKATFCWVTSGRCHSPNSQYATSRNLEPFVFGITDTRFVINDFEGRQVIERITIMGDEVAAAGALDGYEPYVRQGRICSKSA